jgi:hypothetical protein
VAPRRDLGEFNFAMSPPRATDRAAMTGGGPTSQTSKRVRNARWGGARAGAGRPARGPIASEPHQRRPACSPRSPIHVTARAATGVRKLASRAGWRAVRRAALRSLARADFRIIYMALHGRRLELVVEADDRIALARGMQGFEVSAARALNRLLGRRGAVFADRYRPRPLVTRAAVRAAIANAASPLIAVARPESSALARSWIRHASRDAHSRRIRDG